MSQLLDRWQQILDIFESERTVDVIYLDFSKVFDKVKVDHVVILQKLKAIGVSGNLLRWVSSFLVGRTQALVVEGSK